MIIWLHVCLGRAGTFRIDRQHIGLGVAFPFAVVLLLLLLLTATVTSAVDEGGGLRLHNGGCGGCRGDGLTAVAIIAKQYSAHETNETHHFPTPTSMNFAHHQLLVKECARVHAKRPAVVFASLAACVAFCPLLCWQLGLPVCTCGGQWAVVVEILTIPLWAAGWASTDPLLICGSPSTSPS